MADIEISKKYANDGSGTEITVKINGVTELSDVLKALFGDNASRSDTSLSSVPENTVQTSTPNMRRSIEASITPDELKKAIREGRGTDVISPFDEIDIPTDKGDVVTVVCAFVNEKMARFVFKDCWDKHVMNEYTTNYRDSYGRKHVLKDIYPHILQEWRDVITPRKLTETIRGEKVKYSDPLWLLSATDVCGDCEGEYWPVEDDSFQLPIFKRECNRIKEFDVNGTYPYWLRSVAVNDCTSDFCFVSSDGIIDGGVAEHEFGFVPGFDI